MRAEILKGDCREVLAQLPAESVHCVVTSPPYWGLRDYGVDGQIGMEETPGEHIASLLEVFREVRRVLRPDGTLWVNYGDCYACTPNGRSAAASKVAGKDDRTHRDKPFGTVASGLKAKDLVGMPWRVAFALQEDGWWLRRDIIWEKPNAKPESAKDRPTTSHEYVFLLTKSPSYYYDADAIREPHSEESLARIERGRSDDHKWADGGPGGETIATDLSHACHPNGRNKRSVWRVNTASYKGAHYATFPPDLVAPMILAGCPEGGTVLDPFGGSGTVGEVATRLGRRAILIELNPDYAAQAERRNQQHGLEF